MKELYHPKHGILKVLRKQYKALGNKTVWIASDIQGKEHELDGTETPLDKVLSEEHRRREKMKIEKETEKKKVVQNFKEKKKESEKERKIESKLNEISKNTKPMKPKDYEPFFKEISKQIKDKELKIEFTSILKKLDELEFPEPEKQKDYEPLFKRLFEIIKGLPKVDISKIEKKLDKIAEKEMPEFPKPLPFPEKMDVGIEEFFSPLIKKGRLRVEVDRTGGGGGGGGGTVNVEGVATEETLQAVAGLNYDTTSVDLSDMSNIVITYKLSGSTVATETITKTGTTYDIVKT